MWIVASEAFGQRSPIRFKPSGAERRCLHGARHFALLRGRDLCWTCFPVSFTLGCSDCSPSANSSHAVRNTVYR